MPATVDIAAFEKAMADAIGSLGDNVEMTIGFNTDYAVFVHECLTNKVHGKVIYHEPPTQAKFLETAMNRGVSEDFFGRAIAHHGKGIKSIGDLRPALVKAVRGVGLQMLGDAKDLCPVAKKKGGTLAASNEWNGPDAGEHGTLT